MRKLQIIGLLLLFTGSAAFAQAPAKKQNARPELRKGNELYRQQKYKEAQSAYMSALQKDPTSYTGMFNMGDALYKAQQFDGARQALSASAKASKDKKEQARAYHNVGNTFMEEKKWEEAINAYKQSLRLDPTDADTKYNLAYANAMLKKNGGGKDNKDNKDQNKDNKDNKDKNKDNKDNKDQKDQNKDKKDQDQKNQDQKDQKKDGDNKEDKQDQGDKEKQDQQHPQSQPSKLSQQQAENLLNALRQEEKKLQDKKEKGKGVPVKLDKDW